MLRKGIRGFFSSSGHSEQRQHDRRPAERSVSPSRRTFSDIMMKDNIASAEEIIGRWGLDVAGSLFSAAGRPDAEHFLRKVADLHRSMVFFSAEERSSELLCAHDLLATAMRRLEREMHLLLSAHHFVINPIDSLRLQYASSLDASDVEDAEVDGSGEAERDLRAVAKTMISAGYGKECVRIYTTMRKSFVEESIYRLGFDRKKAHVHKLEWKAMEPTIQSWLAVFPVAFRTLFSGERFLCDHVFEGSDTIRESCFADITGYVATRILAFPESVARSKRSPEKIFRLLDLYDAISEHKSDINTLFAFESTAAVRSQALASLLRLAEVARATLADFETAIMRDASRSAVPGGDVHPLTRYVINYVVFLSDYKSVLADIFADFPFQVPYSLPESLFDTTAMATPSVSVLSSSISTMNSLDENSWRSSSSSPTAAPVESISARIITWLVLVLLCKLNGKAELYREVAISYLFLANNLHYIVRKVKESSLGLLLGDEWAVQHSEKVGHYMRSYKKLAWEKLADEIPTETADMTAEEAERRMRRFDDALVAACKGLAVVSDAEMREQVRESVENMIVPPYRSFYERCKAFAASPAELRFSPEDVRNQIDVVFTGSTGNSSSHGSSGSGSGSAHGSTATGSSRRSNRSD